MVLFFSLVLASLMMNLSFARYFDGGMDGVWFVRTEWDRRASTGLELGNTLG